RAQRHARRELAALAHRLRDLDHLVAGQRTEHAPVPSVGVEVGEAELRVLRQHALRLRQIELHAVAVPDLHDQRVTTSVAVAESGRRGGERCAGQRRNHLLQLMVEKLVGLFARAKIRSGGANGDAGEQADEQPEEQLPADRRHVFDAGLATIQPTPRTLRMKSAPSFFRSVWIWTSTALLSTG